MSENKNQYTPMIRQYLEIKEKYKDTLLFYRLGDFYEMFFEDAKIAARELELVLTGRDAGSSSRVPMCGVPHHSVTSYLERLVNKGYKIGIVEQLEDPKKAKGIVKRDVVQTITPGTLIDVGLNKNNNNFLGCFEMLGGQIVFSYVDMSTGEIYIMNLENNIETLKNEISKLEIKELIVTKDINQETITSLTINNKITLSYQNTGEKLKDFDHLFDKISDKRHLRVLNLLIHYLLKTQKRNLEYLKKPIIIEKEKTLQMDNFSKENLELIKTYRSDEKYGSLLWVLDKCKTAMGSRMLKQWILNPLFEEKEIDKRLDVVSSFVDKFLVRKEVINCLKDVYDLERLVAKISYGNSNARDFIQLKKSLLNVPNIKEILKESGDMDLFVLSDKIKNFSSLTSLIETSIEENPPLTIKEGNIIKKGYNKELDKLKEMAFDGKTFIANLEKKEREKTNIKKLKVGYNKVFGYYIEITKSNLDQVKEEFNYTRKQTLTNAERFITPELKEKEEEILKAEEKSVALEYELFQEIKEKVKKETGKIQELANILSKIDILSNFAEIAVLNNYNRPFLNSDDTFDIKDMRHPVLEKIIGEEEFVKNDIYMDKKNSFFLITGPNMGGKSTIIRQVALQVIMCQIGSFTPSSKANLALINKIFTRIGASDDLVSGESTFMVEMNEANKALKNANSKSLILFDEIGRGTSTYDGMALAQAIVEYICVNIKAKTLFATHYHELTYLEDKLEGLKNKNVAVNDENEKVTFLYKLKEGKANKSYGVNVAKLANLPPNLITRANQILETLENTSHSAFKKKEVIVKEVTPEYVKELKKVNPLEMSPMEALNYLYELKKKIK